MNENRIKPRAIKKILLFSTLLTTFLTLIQRDLIRSLGRSREGPRRSFPEEMINSPTILDRIG